MENQIKTAYVLADQDAPEDFDFIMALTVEEKKELLALWKSENDLLLFV